MPDRNGRPLRAGDRVRYWVDDWTELAATVVSETEEGYGIFLETDILESGAASPGALAALDQLRARLSEGGFAAGIVPVMAPGAKLEYEAQVG